MAELSLGGRRVTASYDTVAFYAPEKSHEQALRGALQSFAETLPSGVVLRLTETKDGQ